MNVIRLSGRLGILATFDGGSKPYMTITSGVWRVVRCDDWQYDERTVSALHTLAARPGVELVDPTGLLGGSQYGAERNSIGTEPVPFGQGAAGATKRAAKAKAKPSVTRMMRDRDLGAS